MHLVLPGKITISYHFHRNQKLSLITWVQEILEWKKLVSGAKWNNTDFLVTTAGNVSKEKSWYTHANSTLLVFHLHANRVNLCFWGIYPVFSFSWSHNFFGQGCTDFFVSLFSSIFQRLLHFGFFSFNSYPEIQNIHWIVHTLTVCYMTRCFITTKSSYLKKLYRDKYCPLCWTPTWVWRYVELYKPKCGRLGQLDHHWNFALVQYMLITWYCFHLKCHL